jgi:hypothetical protein
MVAEHAAGSGRRAGVVDACAVAVSVARVSGAGVTMMTPTGFGRVVCFTDEISAGVEELQVTFGEGPCRDAHDSRGPVLSADLQDGESMRRWPLFAPAAREIGAAALYAFPLRMGGVRLGVLDLYHKEPRTLGRRELGDALLLADAATLLLGGLDGPYADDEADHAADEVAHAGRPLRGLEGYRAEIDQAAGMISVQLAVGIEEAFVRLRAHAYAQGRSLTDVARDVVARRLRFTHDLGAGRDGPDRPDRWV